MSERTRISGQIVDIHQKQIYPGELIVTEGRISSLTRLAEAPAQFIMPGFIDAHVHIESSMLVPSEFARLAVAQGTVATVSDPHEIANVCGMQGVEFMINNGEQVPFHFYFGAPSCVPATSFETAGAEVSEPEIERLLQSPKIKYLAEMMNWPGVLAEDPAVYAKLAIAKKYNKPIDGHAPGLRGEDARRYIAAGISTDHECFSREEALDKLKLGMKILIREGSAAKNFDTLIDLLQEHEDAMMFCSDDKHPDSLAIGHINELAKRAVSCGIDLFKVLKAACYNPVAHYQLDNGLLRAGDSADFIVVEDLQSFTVSSTYIKGQLVYHSGTCLINRVNTTPINYFNCKPIEVSSIQVPALSSKITVIEALDGQLITRRLTGNALIRNGLIEADTENDILKIVVLNRYQDSVPAVAFVKNFGLREGSIASSIAHDSHNIIAVGTSDEAIVRAINQVIACKGGIVACSTAESKVLPLPVAGIMTTEDGHSTAARYTELDRFAKRLGSELTSPFMTLSFMALLVIPSIKLSDKGLFDGESFRFSDLHIPELSP